MDWAEFLAARLGEREALAGGPREWHVDHHDCSAPFFQCEQPCDEAAECAEGRCRHCVIEGGDDGMRIYDEGGHDQADAAHIAANDPSWVLADVASKRAILAAHTDRPEHRCPLPVLSGPMSQLWTAAEGACWTVRQMCEPWSGHPDYPGKTASSLA